VTGRASDTSGAGFATNVVSRSAVFVVPCDQTSLGPEAAMQKLLVGVVVAFAAFYLLTQPQGAADVVRGAGGVVGDAFNAVIEFITALFA
jgi:hypothetical protein